MNLQLSEHFTYKKLLRFTLPSIAMMVFTSVYGVVDGYFISNYVGKTAFSAINLIMPFLMIFGAIGFMIGVGGTALVSMKLGEGDRKEANQIFSFLVYLTIIAGLLSTATGLIFVKKVAILFGADADMLPNCVTYGRIIFIALTGFMLQNVFQSFLVAAEKPNLGFILTLISGFTNMILDALFVACFRWGVQGAAMATAISQFVGGLVPLIYFIVPNKSILHLGRTTWKGKALLKTLTNGSSEFMTSVSLSVVNICYNFRLMQMAGENGVAAFGVIMYVDFIYISVYIGYAVGSAPIVGYHYGAGNADELKNMRRKSLFLMTFFGVILTLIAELFTQPLSKILVGYDVELLKLTMRAVRIFSISYLVCGVNIFASSFFTALNNGVVSAAISFLRTLLFQLISIMTLPLILGIDGIWYANVVAEVLALFVSSFFFITLKKKYRY